MPFFSDNDDSQFYKDKIVFSAPSQTAFVLEAMHDL